MSAKLNKLREVLQQVFGHRILELDEAHGELTMVVPAQLLFDCCRTLHNHEDLALTQLTDLCGVDYLSYGSTENESGSGWKGPRFAVVYHLLSIEHNWRLRVRTFLEGDMPRVSSVHTIWSAANWFEREAFDLYGIVFDSHPDLRRILTDYGFIGHPFRKDFPLEGHMEVRYDADKQRVVYEPVSVENRVMIPRIVREGA